MTNEVKATTFDNTQLSTVPLDWKEVYYTNCPLVSASNVDQELGWTREEYKKIGVKYAYLRSTPDNDWYPHYIHNLDNLIRFGGLFPPIHVHADIRRTKLLGVTHAPSEGGCMMVRARDDIYRMTDLKGKKSCVRQSRLGQSVTGSVRRFVSTHRDFICKCDPGWSRFVPYLSPGER